MHVREVLPKDAIPSIDHPRFDREHRGPEDDEVVVVEGDPARAYPLRILDFHEIVNDEVDGEPLAVTWCPLCGSAVVYERTVEGRTLTFGVSGKLADDDLVMYDRETGSEWKQSLGRCIAGELEGEHLTIRPAAIVPCERFARVHPDGLVLQPTAMASEAASDTDDPAPIDFGRRPYERYLESAGFGLDAHRGNPSDRTWECDDIDAKEVVLGVRVDDEAVGYPLSHVRRAGGVVADTVSSLDLIAVATDAGIHAFDHPGGDPRLDGEHLVVDGERYDPMTGRGQDGARLEHVPAIRLFAFSWQDDHGSDAFYTA